MSDFKNAVTDLVKNIFKSQFDTSLTKGPASNNITLSDWNNLVDYCEHLINDVSLLTDFVKKIKNEDLLVNTVDTSNIVYGTNDKGEQVAIHAASIIGHLRLALVHNTANTATPTDDSFTLKIGYNEAGGGEVVVGEVSLDNFVQSYSKNSSYQNGAVYAKLNNKDTMLPTDLSRDRGGSWECIAMRDTNLGIPLPNDSSSGRCAASVKQVRGALSDAEEYADNSVASLAGTVQFELDSIDQRIERLESASLVYTEYEGIAQSIPVPAGSARYAIVEKIGGMTYKNKNLIPYPYIDTNLPKTVGTSTTVQGITFTLNRDRSLTLNGTSAVELFISLANAVSFDKGISISFGTPFSNGIAMYDVETDDGFIMPEHLYIDKGYDVVPGAVKASAVYLRINQGAYFDNFTIRPMLADSSERVDYSDNFDGICSSDVTSIVSKNVDGEIVDTIEISDTIKNKFPAHFKFGDGLDKDCCNYIDNLTETAYGNVARMVLDGREDGWNAKTNSYTGVTRFQINYSGLGYPTVLAPPTNVATPALCNAYESVSASANNSGAKGIAFSGTTFFVHDPAFSTLDAWLAHLQNNPLTIIYKVKEPVSENLSDVIDHTFKYIAVAPRGELDLVTTNTTAAPISVVFVEPKGV